MNVKFLSRNNSIFKCYATFNLGNVFPHIFMNVFSSIFKFFLYVKDS